MYYYYYYCIIIFNFAFFPVLFIIVCIHYRKTSRLKTIVSMDLDEFPMLITLTYSEYSTQSHLFIMDNWGFPNSLQQTLDRIVN